MMRDCNLAMMKEGCNAWATHGQRIQRNGNAWATQAWTFASLATKAWPDDHKPYNLGMTPGSRCSNLEQNGMNGEIWLSPPHWLH